MNFSDLKNKFHLELSSVFDSEEIDSFFYIVLEYLHQLKRIDLALNRDLEVEENLIEKWNSILIELKNSKTHTIHIRRN